MWLSPWAAGQAVPYHLRRLTPLEVDQLTQLKVQQHQERPMRLTARFTLVQSILKSMIIFKNYLYLF